MTSRTSARPACTADSSSNAASACWAARRASVVLPAPGGPYRTMLCGWPASSDWRSAEPAPSRCSWPTNSSSVCGRIRAASGPSAGGRWSGRFSGGSKSRSTLCVSSRTVRRAPLPVLAREWGRIGLTSFGGPPAQVAMLRELCVDRRRWIDAQEFEHANAATQLLPGPGGTQLAVYCAQRVGGRAGGLVGGLAFILPGLVIVLAIAAVALGESPPLWIRALGAGAAAAVVAVVLQAGLALGRTCVVGRGVRALLYVVAGAAATAAVGPGVVLVIVACGLIELAWRR